MASQFKTTLNAVAIEHRELIRRLELGSIGEHTRGRDEERRQLKEPAANRVDRAIRHMFGDADAQSLYITACNMLYRVRLLSPGIQPGPTP